MIVSFSLRIFIIQASVLICFFLSSCSLIQQSKPSFSVAYITKSPSKTLLVKVLEKPVPVRNPLVGSFAHYTIVQSIEGKTFELGVLPQENVRKGDFIEAHPVYLSTAAQWVIYKEFLGINVLETPPLGGSFYFNTQHFYRRSDLERTDVLLLSFLLPDPLDQ